MLDCDTSRGNCADAAGREDAFDAQKAAVVGSLFRLLTATAGPANVPDLSAAQAALESKAEPMGAGKPSRVGSPADDATDAALAVAEEAAARAEALAAARVGFIPLAGAVPAGAALAAAARRNRTSGYSGRSASVTEACSSASGPSGGSGLVGGAGGVAAEVVRLAARAASWVGSGLSYVRLGLEEGLRRVPDRVLLGLADGVPGADAAILAAKRWAGGLEAEQADWMGPLQGVDVDELDVQLASWLGLGSGSDELDGQLARWVLPADRPAAPSNGQVAGGPAMCPA